MATITDSTYYERLENFIPNNKDINAEPVGTASAQPELDAAILKYERELSLNALGVTLYNELQTALSDLGASDQKWQDLVTGRNYTVNSKQYRWEGLRGFLKTQSLVANFVFSRYLRSDEFTYTTVGMVRNEANNAILASFRNKDVIAWNLFTDQYQSNLHKCFSFKNDVILTYSENLNIYNNTTFNNVVASLWQYLNDSNTLDPTSFPDFQFKVYPTRNRFGI